MADQRYDVFVSYRRERGAAEARLIRAELVQHGLRVFLDVTDLSTGYFDDSLLECIANTPNFLLVLSPCCLERCAEEGDWLRRELAHAIRSGCKIVPVVLPGFEFPKALPEDISDLCRHQAVEYSHTFFEATSRKILEMVQGKAAAAGEQDASSNRSETATLSAGGVTRRVADYTAKHRWAVGTWTTVAIAIVASVAWYDGHGHSVPSPEAKRWYDLGIAALRDATYVKAARALQMAVDRDHDFALAHARLADAWDELDFTGKSQREMLMASKPSLESRLSPLDRDYVEAIGATLTHDYAGAVKDYQGILKELPEHLKPSGYVDLGRAEEKAGNLDAALQSYNKAADLAPEDPAPFVHLGILESRLQHREPAEVAFRKAESLYGAETNLEGIAEVDYQRGYGATLRGDNEHAKKDFEKSFQIAGEIPSVQLQVRDLVHLATVEYMADNNQKAVELAQRAIQLARRNGLEYWAIDGLVRLGNAYSNSDPAKAEAPLEDALRLAQEGERPRLEAEACLSLASIRDQQDRPDECITFAQQALNYYKKYGFVSEQTDATTLIVRSQLAKGEFKVAQQGSASLLDLAKKSSDPVQLLIAEELAGMVFQNSERYADALSHFQSAFKLSRTLKEGEAFQTLHCADVLWRLGQYADAEKMISLVPSSASPPGVIAVWAEQVRASIRLSQKKYYEAGRISQQALQAHPDMSATSRFDLLIVSSLADSRLNAARRALDESQQALAVAQQQASPYLVARANMTQAAVCVASHQPQQAEGLAASAGRYFATNDLKESEYVSLYYQAEIKKNLSDSKSATALAEKAIAVYGDLGHTLPTSYLQVYLQRPDLMEIRQELHKLQQH